MKVKYIKNRETDTPNVPFPVHNPRKYLEIDKIYNVYGVFFYQSELLYLIVGQEEKTDESKTLPSWEPAELFEIIDNQLPPDWYFERSREKLPTEKLIDSNSAIWGYRELACSPHHSDRLLEREIEDIKIFLKRKHEIDEWESKQNTK